MISKSDRHSIRMLIVLLALVLMLPVAALPVAALAEETAGDQKAANDAAAEEAYIPMEINLDPYYTSMDLFVSLTDEPIPEVRDQSEFQIYSDMLRKSFVPRFVLIEMSVNPLPIMGTWLKAGAPDVYDQGNITDDLNIWKSLTAGFEEPWALSFFFGNVVNFALKGETEASAGSRGYMGYLFTTGTRHIKDNELINDQWYEAEWKIKGDRRFESTTHSWSFRVGAKWHEHPNINNVLYLGMRRSRVDFEASSSIFRNSAFEYKLDVDQNNLEPVQHKFFVEKKFPLKSKRVFSVAVGFVADKGRKYSGHLKEVQPEEFQLIFRPNFTF